MKEIFEARSQELANRHILRQHRDTESYLVTTGVLESWAFPRHLFHRVVESNPLRCPNGALWNGKPCVALLNWDAMVYPVIDWFGLVQKPLTENEQKVFALSFHPRVALELPRDTSLRELETSHIKPTKRVLATGSLDGVYVADWSALL